MYEWEQETERGASGAGTRTCRNRGEAWKPTGEVYILYKEYLYQLAYLELSCLFSKYKLPVPTIYPN